MEDAAQLRALSATPQKRLSEKKRFAILVLGSFACICSSIIHTTNLVLPRMQARYGFTQRDISSISTVNFSVGYFLLPYGFLFDYAGPVPVLCIAAVLVILGATLIAQAFVGTIAGSVAALATFMAIFTTGCNLFDLVSCVTVTSYFPSHRGIIIALLKTFTGLGSAIIGCLQLGFFGDNIQNYFYFLMALALVVDALCIAFMRLPPYHLTQYQRRHFSPAKIEQCEVTKVQYLKQKPPMWRFYYGFSVLVLLIVYLPAESAVVSYLHLGRSTKLAFAIVACILTFFFLIVAIPVSWRCSRSSSEPSPPVLPIAVDCNGGAGVKLDGYDGEDGDEDPTLRMAERGIPKDSLPVFSDERCEPTARDDRNREGNSFKGDAQDEMNGGGEADGSSLSRESRALASPAEASPPLSGAPIQVKPVVQTELDFIAPQYQTTFLGSLRTVNMWLMFWTFFTIIGAESVIIPNASAVFTALSGEKTDAATISLLTVLNGVGSAVGRLAVAGFEVWSQAGKPEERIPLTIALFFSHGVMIIALILFLSVPKGALPLPYVIAALANGFQAASMVLVMRTLFAKDVAKHYNFCFLAAVFASITLNRFLYGEWMSVQAEKLNSPDHLCYRKRCILMPLCVLLGLLCTGVLTTVYVHIAYSKYCRKVLAERARLLAEGDGDGTDEGKLANLDVTRCNMLENVLPGDDDLAEAAIHDEETAQKQSSSSS